MESGLEDRNNNGNIPQSTRRRNVSMESGLEDRNNAIERLRARLKLSVSMESGLEDRNNARKPPASRPASSRLNGVRPRRPEQSGKTNYMVRALRGSQWSPA